MRKPSSESSGSVSQLKIHQCNLHLGAGCKFALVTRRPYCPGGPKKLCFTTLSLIPMVSIARLSVVKQSSFGLSRQCDRRVTRMNSGSSRMSQTPSLHLTMQLLTKLIPIHGWMYLPLAFEQKCPHSNLVWLLFQEDSFPQLLHLLVCENKISP